MCASDVFFPSTCHKRFVDALLNPVEKCICYKCIRSIFIYISFKQDFFVTVCWSANMLLEAPEPECVRYNYKRTIYTLLILILPLLLFCTKSEGKNATTTRIQQMPELMKHHSKVHKMWMVFDFRMYIQVLVW